MNTSTAINSIISLCHQETDPDISGIGVRLAFYIQSLISVLLVARSPGDADETLAALSMLTIGLLGAGAILGARHQFSLYQAVLVSQLAFLSTIASLLATACYTRTSSPSAALRYIAVLQFLGTCIETLILWTTADWAATEAGTMRIEDGDGAKCYEELQICIPFCLPISAVSRMAIVTLVVGCVLLFVAMLYVDMRICWTASNCSEPATVTPLPSPPLPTTDGSLPPRPPPRRSPSLLFPSGKRSCDALLVGAIVVSVPLLLCLVLSIEFTRAVNDPDGNDMSWGFGQILPVFMVLPSLLSVTKVYARHGLWRSNPYEALGADDVPIEVWRQGSVHLPA